MGHHDIFKQQQNVEGITILSVHGEINMETAPRFKAALMSAWSTDETFAIDLTNCPYLDSSGITVLISAYKAFGYRPLNLVVPATSFFRRLFHIAGIENLFRLVERVDQLEELSPRAVGDTEIAS